MDGRERTVTCTDEVVLRTRISPPLHRTATPPVSGNDDMQREIGERESMRNQNKRSFRSWGLLMILLLFSIVACESKAEREAKATLRKAADQELVAGLGQAVTLYEKIIREYPETESAKTARSKVESFRKEQEEKAQTLLNEARARPRSESIALLNAVVARYPGTKASELAGVRSQALETALRLEQEQAERQRQEEQRRAKQAEEERKRQEERRREAARLAEQNRLAELKREAAQRERELKLQAEQARLRQEQERLWQAQEASRRVVIEYSYTCECSCGQKFLAFPAELKRFSVTAPSEDEAETKAYDYYGKGPAYSRNKTVSLGNCPWCYCNRSN